MHRRVWCYFGSSVVSLLSHLSSSIFALILFVSACQASSDFISEAQEGGVGGGKMARLWRDRGRKIWGDNGRKNLFKA